MEQGRGFERGVISGHPHPALSRGVVLLVGSSTGGVTCLEATPGQEPRLVGRHQLGFSSQVQLLSFAWWKQVCTHAWGHSGVADFRDCSWDAARMQKIWLQVVSLPQRPCPWTLCMIKS